MVTKRVRRATTYPMPPDGRDGLVGRLAHLVGNLPGADRVSAGFPGMVRGGAVLSAPHFVTTGGPGTDVDPALAERWTRFDLASALAEAIGKPARVANDADVQGLAVVEGRGLELVITLGTGFGTSFFLDGALMPHLEVAHHRFRKGETYNEQLGESVRKQIGDDRWRRRVRKAIVNMDGLFFCDRIYVGGGNGRRVKTAELEELAAKVTLIDNAAGILGGVKLWEARHLGV